MRPVVVVAHTVAYWGFFPRIMRLIAKFTIPYFLSTEYWLRHRLSKPDILYLLNLADNKILWRLVLNLGGTLPYGLIHSSSYRQYEVLVSGKTKAIEEIMKLVHYTYSDQDKLDTSSTNTQRYNPVLPVYFIPTVEFILLLSGLRRCIDAGNTGSPHFVWLFMNSEWIPEVQDQCGLCCVRIIPNNPTISTTFTPVIKWNGATWIRTSERILIMTTTP